MQGSASAAPETYPQALFATILSKVRVSVHQAGLTRSVPRLCAVDLPEAIQVELADEGGKAPVLKVLGQNNVRKVAQLTNTTKQTEAQVDDRHHPPTTQAS